MTELRVVVLRFGRGGRTSFSSMTMVMMNPMIALPWGMASATASQAASARS